LREGGRPLGAPSPGEGERPGRKEKQCERRQRETGRMWERIPKQSFDRPEKGFGRFFDCNNLGGGRNLPAQYGEGEKGFNSRGRGGRLLLIGKRAGRRARFLSRGLIRSKRRCGSCRLGTKKKSLFFGGESNWIGD